MPPARFEPTISAGERPQTYALDRAATGTGKHLDVPLGNRAVSSPTHHAVRTSNSPISLYHIKASLISKIVPVQAMKCMGEWRYGCTHS